MVHMLLILMNILILEHIGQHFILEGKTLTDFTNLFSPNNFKKNDDIILNYSLTNL